MLLKLVLLFLWIFLKIDFVEGYTWAVPLPLGVSICSETTSKLYLNWTYTPATPPPFTIEWTKEDGSGMLTPIARFRNSTNTFTPLGSYGGRVNRTGSTAEIVIYGTFTAADAGIYKVSVTPSSGPSLDANETVPQTNVTKEPIKVACKEERIFCFTVTCTLGIETNLTLELWNGDTLLKSDTASASGITTTIPDSSGFTIKCSVTGQGSDCRTSNNKYEKLPVSSFVSASIGVVTIIIIIKLVLDLQVFYFFNWIDSVKLTAEDDLPVDDDLCNALFKEHKMKTKQIFGKKKEAHIIFEKSVKAKEITKQSVLDRRVKIEPKRDDNVRKFLWSAAIICGFILVVITIIFIILISVKCSGASSEGIFIAAVLISAIGLIFGLANVVVLLLFLKMGGGTSESEETTQDCTKQPKKTPLHQSVRKHNVDNRLPPERHNTEDIKSTAVPLQLSKARSTDCPRPLPPRRLPPLNTTLTHAENMADTLT